MTFDDLFSKHQKLVSEAFRRAIDTITSDVLIDVVAKLLEDGDIMGAIEALQIDENAFAELEKALQEVFTSGGEGMIGELPTLRRENGPAVVWKFSVRNPAAEALIREQSSNLIHQIVYDQKIAIRAALEAGLSLGMNPRTTALDLVGRISRATGKRVGGIIGLTARQEEWQRSYRADLASNDPQRLKEALKRGLRDKRFDRSVLKAIRTGEPLSSAMIAKMVTAYRNRSLKYRGDMIGRTETLSALSRARQNAIQQQIEAGLLQSSHVTKIWDATGDLRTRPTHAAMEGQERPYDGAFQSPSGATLRYPHDPNAPAEETIQCRCQVKYRVDYIAAGLLKYRKRVGNT